MSRKVSVFACGGFGANMLRGMLDRSAYQEMADHLSLYALDTSKSNLKAYNDHEHGDRVKKFLVPDADGSGKHRAENYDPILNLVEEVVNSGAGEGINILVYSASGGSGAVIGPELHHVLTARGRPCISLVLGTDASIQDLENTLKTIKTLSHKAANIVKKNFTVYYGTNRKPDGQVSSAHANELFLQALDDLICLGHPDMEYLDSKDIEHWIQPPMAEGAVGNIRLLSIIGRKAGEEIDLGGEVPVSTLSLISQRGQDPLIIPGVRYTAHGLLPQSLHFGKDSGIDELQFQIFAGKGAKLANVIEGQIKNYHKLAEAAAQAAAGDEIKLAETDKIASSGAFL